MLDEPRSLVLRIAIACLALGLASPASAQSMGSYADAAHACSTSPLTSWELRAQLASAEACWYPSALVSFTTRSGLTISSGALRYLSPETRTAVYAASSHRAFNVNSAFRTLVEQYYLFTARSPACMAVATPGSSNHESGTAVDVSPDGTNVSVRTALQNAGCRWLGTGDRVHFDCLPRGAARHTVITFQRLWNLNHPTDRLTEDNAYGAQTLARLRASPIHGFAHMPCTTTPPPPDGGMPDGGMPDAGPGDAGSRDAGVTDANAGLDAAVFDAGPRDADTLDGGAGETSHSDASRAAQPVAGGCACRATSAGSRPAGAIGWLLLALAVVARRRRR